MRIQPREWLAGGGDIGALMRSMDWSTTRLGAIDDWTPSLGSAVGICLGSRFPIVMYWGPDRVVLYNDAYADILGKKHPWALGRPCREVWSEIWDVIGPMLDGVMTRGEATWSDDQVLFLERRGYPEECYFSFSFSPVRGADGSVEGIFTAVIETTRRVLGERRLRTLRDLAARAAAAADEEQAWKGAIEALEANREDFPFALLYRADENGQTAQLAGAAGAEAGAQVPLVIDLAAAPEGLWPNDRPGATVLPVSRPGVPAYGYLVAGLSARRAFDEEYRAFLDLVADHVATGIANARAYEEERKRANALAELDRAKTAFFSNVSHEFRTPLTLMLGPLEDVLARPAGHESSADRDLLTLVYRNGLRLQKLVNTLLEFSRIEAGRVQATYEPTDLGALTADLASNFRSACERAGLRLLVDCPPLAEPAYVDRDMWEKVVLNLLSNAFKFTLAGEIAVAVAATSDSFELAVRDTGIGVPAGEMDHLFERFHRVKGARARTDEGTGIGLALVHELVKLHGGSIRVESRPEAGSTFTVSIPKGKAHLPADRIAGARTLASTAPGAGPFVEEALRWSPDTGNPAGAPAATADQGARVLWADDNADMRDYVGRLLSARYDVEAVADGEAALRAARERPPDLVLADVMMPGLDGFGLLRELRADARTRELPIILLSARAGEESRVEGLAAGADDYLIKPFSARELVARVESHLKMARIRREAAEAVRASEARFREMADTAPATLWIADPTGCCTFLSRGWYVFTGQTPETALGFGWTDAVHPDDRGRARDIFLAANEAREPFALDYRLRRADGEYRWSIDAGRPRFDPSGGFLGYVGSVIDITEHKRAEDTLREAGRRKDEFLAILAHELRNPLAPLRNALEIIRLSDERQAREQARDMMVRQVGHMVRLVDDLLDVSRITRGKVPLHKAHVGLALIVGSAVETARPLVEGGGHELTVTLPPEPIHLHGDPTRLAQVLSNLLNNSAKYSDRGGHIALRAERRGGEVAISVQDDGIGIPAEELPRVFDMFSQVDRSLERSQGGLGIGLALVKGLVEMHGGSVEARSEGAGRGSEFIVRLPVVAEGPASEQAEGADRAKVAAPRRRVLVADDNPDSTESLEALLKFMGSDVRVAHDGLQAVQVAAEFRPELILMDVGMPGLSGLEATRRIRAQPGGETVRIFALTGWGQEPDKHRSAEAGCDGHLVKPIDPAALRKLLG